MIWDRLRAIRERQGLSQRAAGLAAGMSHQYLSNLENGRIRNPSLETLERLARAYGLGVDQLIGHGRQFSPDELPEGLRELLADPEWGEQLGEHWVETLMGIQHVGRRPQTKQEFLETFLALRRILQ